MKRIVIGIILLSLYAEARGGGGSGFPLLAPILITLYLWQNVFFKDKRTRSERRYDEKLKTYRKK